MPVSLFVSGLGAYSGAVDLRIPDCALVAGPSESGKTSLLSALSLALTGSTPHGAEEDEAIHGERATVEAGVAGVALSWSRRVGGRAIARVGDTNCPSLAAHRAAVGLDPVITQAILWPLRWVDLARSPRARALRDLLASVLPAGDLAAIIAESADLRADDLIDVKGAEVRQTAANRARDEARGALAQAERMPVPDEAPPPNPAHVEAARALLAEIEAWRRYEDAIERHTLLAARHSERAERIRQWHSRAAVAPPGRTARNALADARREVEALLSELALSPLPARPPAHVEDHCPTCGQALPDAAAAAERHAANVASYDAAVQARAEIQARIDAATDRAAQLQGPADDEAAAEIAAQSNGPCPSPLPDPGPVPEAPAGARPDFAREAGARAYLDRAQQAEGAAGRRAAAIRALEAAVMAARAQLQAAEVEAARVAQLVVAVRGAPAELVRRGRVALDEALAGSGVGVVLAEPGESGDEVRVTIDGRPWWIASTGRQVAADAALRAAIRSLAAARYPGGPIGYNEVPVVIDRAQDWSGEWPSIAAPWWRLETRSGALVVRKV
jgi:hypothetical protein